MRRPDSVVFATGARGSGKTSWLKQYARGFGRVLVWSPVEESDDYAGVLGAGLCTDILSFLTAASGGARRLVYAPPYPTPAVFDVWCKVVYRVGTCLALVDELADVTPIGKAFGWWGALLRKGRHRRISIAGGAQRPAEIDKTILGNSTRLIVFRLARVTDRRLMADELGVDRDVLDALHPLQFLDCDRLTGSFHRSKIVFAR